MFTVADKNMDQVEHATQMFKEIQHAYNTLSNDNERAWYDQHRDAILAGGDGIGGDDDDGEDEINLFAYFNTSCFSGYKDTPKVCLALLGTKAEGCAGFL